MAFELVQGINVKDAGDVHSAYSIDENGIYATFSADVFGKALSELVSMLNEPVFFFLEVPCSDEEENQLRNSKSDPYHYKIYYLDNCTLPVAMAILGRYGEILINDGVSRFGFGSHDSGEEIYCRDYQTLSIYGKSEKYKRALDALYIPCEDEILTMWEVLSDDNVGICSTVEINGETVCDIINALKSEGMYLSDTVEEVKL